MEEDVEYIEIENETKLVKTYRNGRYEVSVGNSTISQLCFDDSRITKIRVYSSSGPLFFSKCFISSLEVERCNGLQIRLGDVTILEAKLKESSDIILQQSHTRKLVDIRMMEITNCETITIEINNSINLDAHGVKNLSIENQLTNKMKYLV